MEEEAEAEAEEQEQEQEKIAEVRSLLHDAWG